MSLEGRVLPNLPPLMVSQSLAAYVREHLAMIEALLSAGAKYEAILQALERAGHEEPTYGALDNALWRARRRARAMPGPDPNSSLIDANAVAPAPVPAGIRVTLTPTRDLKAEDLF